MIKELIVTIIIIAAAVVPAMQLFSFFESEVKKAFVVVSYGVFCIAMLLYWGISYIIYQINL